MLVYGFFRWNIPRLKENCISKICWGFWISAKTYTNLRWISVLSNMCFHRSFRWSLPAEGKLYFEHLLGILDFSEIIYNFSVDLSFTKHVFLWVLLLENIPADCILSICWGFWISAKTYTDSRRILVLSNMFFCWLFWWIMPTEGKLYFEHRLGILDFSEHIYIFSADLSFIKHFNYWLFYWNMPTWGKLYFEHLLRNLEFSENIHNMLMDLSFIKHVCPFCPSAEMWRLKGNSMLSICWRLWISAKT